MTFGEAKLEAVILGLLADQGYPHTLGGLIDRTPEEVLIKSDQRDFFAVALGESWLSH